MRNRSSCGEVIENKSRVASRTFRVGTVLKLSRELIAFAFLSGFCKCSLLTASRITFIGKSEPLDTNAAP